MIPSGVLAASDVVAPSGSFTSPTNGSNISGTITISVSVADNDQIASVQFKIDGTNQGSPITSAPFQITGYDTHLLTAGSHTFSAVVTDRVGNSTTLTSTVTNVNSVPASGSTLLGDWQLWSDGDGAYSSGRNPLPNFNHRDTWDWIWQATGSKFGYKTMPSNPDSTHYQMKAQAVSSRCEGGKIGLILNGVEQTAFAPAGFSQQFGTVYNLNGGESLGGRCWLNGADDADEEANTFFEQGIGLTYWFEIKGGYLS